MPKSKYPTQLDTSIEIPVVRDNILEIGSDALNSIRSAIFQIERTLGINPQGAVGNTVADRLNKVVDGNGNILKDALSRANIVSGPISNSDISKTASISESKLNLDFPTQLLQDEISIINSQIDEVMDVVREVSNAYAVHVNTHATGRHPATAISVEGVDAAPSSTATLSLEDGTVQSVFEEIYNSHINYTGGSISEDNNSHMAEQIFFDTTGSIASLTDADDVQEVIEDLASSMLNFEVNHQDLFHANGILKIGRSYDPEDSETGRDIVFAGDVFFDKTSSDGHKTTRITLSTPVDIVDFNPERSDIVKITDDGEDYELEIDSVGISSDGLSIETIDVFGEFYNESSTSATAMVVRNINQKISKSCLLVAPREYADETSSYMLQVSNPNSASIISNNINPEALTVSNRYIDISIDGGTNVSLDLYNSGADRQSIDSIVSIINEQAAEQHLNILAYRVDIENENSELSISHNLPDDGSDSRTISIKRSSLDDAIDDVGLSHVDGKEVGSEYGASYYISGKSFIGLKEKVLTSSMLFVQGERIISSTDSSVNFIELGLCVGDLLVVDGSDSDDGSYVISGVREDQIEIDIGQLPSGFVGASNDLTKILCYDNCISLENFNFDATSGTFGAMLIDVFIDNNQSLFAAKRLEYAVVNFSSVSLVEIVDFDGEIEDEGEMELEVSSTSDGLMASLDGGEAVKIAGSSSYVYLTSGLKNITLKVLFRDEGLIDSYISANSDILIDIFCYSPINLESNLLIARVPFGNFKGRVIGGSQYGTGRSISKLEGGTTGIDQIGRSAVNILSERPLHETRSNGVIYGLEISNPQSQTDSGFDFYTFDIQRGVAYVMGERFQIESRTIATDIPSDGSIDKFFILIDEYGNIIFEKADAYCSSPAGDSETCMLATIEDSGAILSSIDLRLFINDLDLKVLNSITVSPQPGMGHFSQIGPAIKYAKRFAEVFPDAGVPTVHLKSGVHEVVLDIGVTRSDYLAMSTVEQHLIHNQAAFDYGLWINFPINIIGEGYSTVLDSRCRYADYDADYDDRKDGGTCRSALLIAGPGVSSDVIPVGDSDLLNNGRVRISNFRLRLTGIWCYDFGIEDSDGNKLNYDAKFDNLIFDYSEKSEFTTLSYPVYIGASSLSSIDSLGNLHIVGCSFLNCPIHIENMDAENVRNISILDNIFKGSGDGVVDSGMEDYYAIWHSGGGHVFSCEDCPAENNVNIVGNINADNDGTNDAYMDPAKDHPWGDRIARNLTVPGDLNVCGSITSGSYLFSEDQTRVQLITFERDSFTNDIVDYDYTERDFAGGAWDDLGWFGSDGPLGWIPARRRRVFPGGGTDGGGTVSDYSANGYTIPVLIFDSIESIAFIKFDLRPGETIKSIFVGIHTNTLSYGNTSNEAPMYMRGLIWSVNQMTLERDHFPVASDPTDVDDWIQSVAHVDLTGGATSMDEVMIHNIGWDGSDLGDVSGDGGDNCTTYYFALKPHSEFPSTYTELYVNYIKVETTMSKFSDIYNSTNVG